ncbi:MAG: hypothetical protein OEY38_09070 [Gammaproteobacteria bacterium]|nr:hypothetical protein [Gammaproteobacteria bacterium]
MGDKELILLLFITIWLLTVGFKPLASDANLAYADASASACCEYVNSSRSRP